MDVIWTLKQRCVLTGVLINYQNVHPKSLCDDEI